MNEKSKYKIIIAVLSNEATVAEKEALMVWLSESEAHQTEYGQIVKLYHKTNRIESHQVYDVEKAWRLVSSQTIQKQRRQWFVKLSRYAAIILFPMLILFSIHEYTLKDGAVEMLAVSVPSAMTKNISLPDGTEVVLNANSTLTYPKKFKGNTREVFLTGEANFSIFSNKKKPFIVNVDHLNITALGTKFNVKAYDLEKIITTLEEGSVRVATDQDDILLLPNEQVIYLKSADVFEKKEVDIKDVTGWLSGDLIFDAVPLSEMFAEIERRYGVQIITQGVIDDDTHYSIRYKKDESLAHIFEILSYMVEGFAYEILNTNHIVVSLNSH